jgi:hypothetical protein
VTDTTLWFPIVKVMHIGGLILWLGPSGGAWLVLMITRREVGDPSLVSHYLYLGFLRMLWVEHLGFVVMIGSGVALLSMYGFSAIGMTWLHWKLALVLGIVIPIEVADMWFSHRRLPGIFASRQPDAPYSKEDLRILRLYHRRFVPIALPVLLTTVVAVMWLALAKPV